MSDGPQRNVAEELAAIKAVADALEPLSNAGRRHVISYVADALGLVAPIAAGQVQAPPTPTPAPASAEGEPPEEAIVTGDSRTDAV